ncbi:MAG: ABC transporter ATP-binding protein [Mariniphaga sp.]|nr:ABC transporter ATP-binding protein [Mariniphaga sp.]
MIGEEKIIALNNATIGYKAKTHSVNVVKSGISVHALKGELVALIGGNGVGKSTLLRTIAGFQPSMGGDVLIRGKQVNAYREKELALIMSFVSTEIIRVPNLSVFDLVSLGRYPHTNWFGKLLDEDRDIVAEAINSVGLKGYENRMVNCISDGERQKAMIARTLAQNTDVIVLDEPTAFLDLSNKYEIVHILHELANEKGKTILFSTHDLTTAIAESDRMWVMLNGSVEQGSPEDLILNGDFASLFQSEHLFFDQEKGDFRIRKQTKRKAIVRGRGLAVDWTIKALERNGFEIIDSANSGDGAAYVKIDVTYPEWTVKEQSQTTKFNSLLSVCRYLKGM